ncbi:hypothetical protein NN561_008413 [Cricetulus griseus]
MPAVSLPPKENALFKRILVSVRLRAGGGERLAGSRACHSQARAGGRALGHPEGDPAVVVRAGRAHSFVSPRWCPPRSARRVPRASEASVPD